MKRLVGVAAAGAMLLSMATPAMAGICDYMDCGGGGDSSSSVSINNHAFVYNKAYTKADTGDNDIGGKCVFGGKIYTGAATATSQIYNDVNSSILGCDDCFDNMSINNHAMVFNKAYTKAYTGDNGIHGKYVGGGYINTGDAGAGGIIDNIVKLTWTNGTL